MKIAEILMGIMDVYTKSSLLQSLLPGGLHSGTPKQDVPRPYGILKIVNRGFVLTSHNRKIGTYVIYFNVYGHGGLGELDAIAEVVEDIFDFNINWSIPDAKVLSCINSLEELDNNVESESALGDDVLKWRGSYRMKINEPMQLTRSQILFNGEFTL